MMPMSECRALIPYQTIPQTFIADTADLIHLLQREIFPMKLPPSDIREVVNQVADIMSGNRYDFVMNLRKLPDYNRIVSRTVFDTVERQHMLKAAVENFGLRFQDRLERIGAFQAVNHRGEFPYIFYDMVGHDAHFEYFKY